MAETATILNILVYEEIDGQPTYYRGCRDVLAQQKAVEDIVGRSMYQV